MAPVYGNRCTYVRESEIIKISRLNKSASEKRYDRNISAIYYVIRGIENRPGYNRSKDLISSFFILHGFTMVRQRRRVLLIPQKRQEGHRTDMSRPSKLKHQ